LGAIKGAGQAAIEALVAARKQGGAFKNLFDFCGRVGGHKINRRMLDALVKAGAFDQQGVHRASVLATLPQALQQAEQIAASRNQGQKDLFARFEEPSYEQHYVEVAPWDEQESLSGEKETLGFYFSGHPIRRHLAELDQLTTCRLAQASPQQPQPVMVAGMVGALRAIQTKRGDRMAIVTIDDGETSMDITCFSDVYQDYRPLLVSDQLILVSGEVSVDTYTSRNRLLAKEILSLEQARLRAVKHLELHLSEAQEAKLGELAQILQSHRGGNCPLVIRYLRSNNAANIVPDASWRVKLTDKLLELLRGILAVESVVVVFK